MADPEGEFPGYTAPPWLRGAHAQTIVPFLLPRERVALRRERITTPDGDFWDFDWADGDAGTGTPLVVLFHGLEGSSRSHYARALLAHVLRERWRGVVVHFRGCSGEANLRPRAYHSGDHEEVDAMLSAIHDRVAPGTKVFAAGVSLGGSALLNWLGRAGTTAATRVTAAAAVCAPLDLVAAGHAIDRGANRIYAQHFLRTLKPKSRELARRFPGVLDPAKLAAVGSMYEFDDAVTAPLHGFAGTLDYWTRASSLPWLGAIGVPTLVINARNDPFVPHPSLPPPGRAGRFVTVLQPAHGGHVGFLHGAFPGRLDWLPRRLLHFFRHGH